MTVVVRRLYSIEGVHIMSVVVDKNGAEYVLPRGRTDEILTPERPLRFVDEFRAEYGKEPSSPEDWAECAVYNMGYSIVGDPMENSYKSKTAAAKAERREIDSSIKKAADLEKAAKVFSDDDMKIGPNDTIEAIIDSDDGSVVALTLSFGRTGGNSDFLYHREDGKWTNDPRVDITDENMDYKVVEVPASYIANYDNNKRDQSDILSPVTAAASCPIATQDITVNIANRQKAIDAAGYGPLNPRDPNIEFWRKKANRWDATYAEAKRSICGNCSAFIRTPSMLECISEGLSDGGSDASNGWDTIDAGELGYCEAFDFKCAAERTCDAWIVGGPVTEEK